MPRRLDLTKLKTGKKVYFASDFHLGVPSHQDSLIREKKIVRWLESISEDAGILFLVGDIFDFWFEYRYVAPKGHVRLLGKLAELSDKGVEIILFAGNHDLWFRSYLKNELQVEIIHEPVWFELNDRRFFVAHGDGLNPKDLKFRFIKSIFTNPLCQWLFGWLHPTIAFWLAKVWSQSSRDWYQVKEHEHLALLQFARQLEVSNHHDYYVFGDCHVARLEPLAQGAVYVNLGDWIQNFSYGVFDGQSLTLAKFEDQDEGKK